MDCNFSFSFESIRYTADAFFSVEDDPCYIFVFFDAPVLVREFGREVTLKTDCEVLFPRNDEHLPRLRLFRTVLFEALRSTPVFEKAKDMVAKRKEMNNQQRTLH